MFSAARTGRFWLRRGTFISDWPQLHRAGGPAFFTPMALGAGEAFPHSAIVANENLFPHLGQFYLDSRECQAHISRIVPWRICPGGAQAKSLPVISDENMPPKGTRDWASTPIDSTAHSITIRIPIHFSNAQKVARFPDAASIAA